jgi:hypothetical protein
MDSFGANTYGSIAARAARGSVTSPTQTQADDTLFRISTQGWGTTNYVSTIGRINLQATQNFTDTAAGTRVRFQLTPPNSSVIQTITADIDYAGLSFVGNTNTSAGITFRDGSRQTSATVVAATTSVLGIVRPDNTSITVSGGVITAPRYFASFYDTTTQTSTTVSATVIKLNTVDIDSAGVTLNTSTGRMTIVNPGIYDVQFSAQLSNSDGGQNPADAYIWLRQNGTNIPNSAGYITVPAKHGNTSGATIASWNYYVRTTTANEYIEFWWHNNVVADCKIQYYSSQAATAVASAVPGAPSIIVTVNSVIIGI